MWERAAPATRAGLFMGQPQYQINCFWIPVFVKCSEPGWGRKRSKWEQSTGFNFNNGIPPIRKTKIQITNAYTFVVIKYRLQSIYGGFSGFYCIHQQPKCKICCPSFFLNLTSQSHGIFDPNLGYRSLAQTSPCQCYRQSYPAQWPFFEPCPEHSEADR